MPLFVITHQVTHSPKDKSMAQTVLNFCIDSINERLTSRLGEIVFGEYLKVIGLDKLCDTYLPQPQSNQGYAPFSFIQPLLLMLHSGGCSLDDLRMIQSDTAMKDVPTADGTGTRYRYFGINFITLQEKSSHTQGRPYSKSMNSLLNCLRIYEKRAIR